jgi:hypothetical protein
MAGCEARHFFSDYFDFFEKSLFYSISFLYFCTILIESNMNNKEPGYVYILTNPSFREDWVKIGKSSRPVDVRSKELDNTSVPLPFEIFATMKTAKYNEAEKLVHRYIERFTNLRIRNNREFFNVKPEEALNIFYDVAMLLDDAEIKLTNTKKCTSPIRLNESSKPDIKDRDFTMEDLTGKISIILNGKVSYKSRFGFDVVKEYLNKHPETTMKSLKTIFNDDLLGEWNQWKMLEDNIEYAKRLKDITGSYRHQVKRQFILQSSDKIKFVVSNQWSIVNVMNLIHFVQKQGWDIKIKNED